MEKAREICPTLTKKEISEGALLVDVRERDEVESLAFDVPNIVNIPLSEFEERFTELPKDRQLVMVCKVGGRSLKATYFLMNHGYTNVSNMSDGIEKWVKKGFPTRGNISTLKNSGSSCCGTTPEVKPENSCCGSKSEVKASNSCC